MDNNAPKFCFACGTGLPPGARFCPQCGTPVAAAAPARPDGSRGGPDDHARTEPAGERRPVVVLFADLAGYTRLSNTLDPEEVHRLLGRYFEMVDTTIHRYGGTIDKHIGDAVMGVFGAPLAHGNDAERAVRAAFDIHLVMARLSQDSGRTLAAHIGIAAGEVVAAGTGSSAHREYTVTGDAVNLAARLDEMAGAGETLVSGAVHNAVAHMVGAESRGDIAIRGLDQAMAVWKLLSLRERQSVATPLVGRAAECRQFAALAGATRDSGRGVVLLLRGEAGIGKTRLIEEFRVLGERAGFASHRGLVLDFGVARDQDAAGELVSTLLGNPPQAPAEARRAALGRATGEGLLAPESLPFAADLMALPLEGEMRRLYDAMDNSARTRGKAAAIAALLGKAAEHRPRLLIVEDVHWADATLLGLLAAAGRATAACPAILVMTSRVEGDRIDAAWRAAAGPGRILTMDLGALAPEDALIIAGEFARANERLVQACIARAGGNPLFLVQLLHSARENEAAGVPATIQSLVLARVDRLAPRDKEAIQAASVIGQRFSLPLLRRLLGDEAYRCDALVAQNLARDEGEDFLFAHALIQEGVYSSLLKSRKRELHARAAGWFAGHDPALRAEHLDRAEHPDAAAAYLDAAQALAAEMHLDRALPLAERGSALALEAPLQYALALLHGQLLRELGRNRDALAAFEKARGLADDDISRCRAWIEIASVHRNLTALNPALEALAAAQPIAERAGLPLERARIHYLRGNVHFGRGDAAACMMEHESALLLARAAGDAECEAQALSGLGDVAYAHGRMRSAGEHFQRCVEICEREGLLRFSVMNRAMIAWSLYFCGEVSDSCARLREARALAVRLGHANAQVMTEESLANMLVWRGAYEEAEEVLDQAIALAREVGAKRYEGVMLNQKGLVLVRTGRRDKALGLMRAAWRLVEETGAYGFFGPPALGGIARTTPDAAERRAVLDRAEAMLAEGALIHCHLWFYSEAMRDACERGEWNEVDRYAAAMDQVVSGEPLPWANFQTRLWRTLARHGRGERSERLRAELAQLREEALTYSFGGVLADIDAALLR